MTPAGDRGAASTAPVRLVPLARAVLAHPALWPTALSQAARLARRGWWRRWPPLPTPDPGWTAFRLETQYGDAGATPEPGDVVDWLRWCRASRRASGQPRVHGAAKPVR
jgi:hypothetical protein